MAFCREVHEFVRACEALLSMLAQGGNLTMDEKGVLELSAIEILAKVRPH